MQFIEVKSQAVYRIGYDTASKTVGVILPRGEQYNYFPITPEIYEQFRNAPSIGKFWLGTIKQGVVAKLWQCQKVGDESRGGRINLSITKGSKTKVATIEAESPAALAISFEAGSDSVGFPALPFEQMVERLKGQMDTFCAPLLAEIETLSNVALAVTVIDGVTLTEAGKQGEVLASKRKHVGEIMKPTKRAIDSVKAVVLAKEKELLTAVEVGEGHLSSTCTQYRVAEQKRAQAAANAERDRLLRAAEDKRIADAEKAQAAGHERLAEKLISTPVTAPKVEVKADLPKGAGGSGRTLYRWRVAKETDVPREWLCLDEKKIGQHARENKLPDGTIVNGIEFYQEPDTNF